MTPSFNVKQGGGAGRHPTILWFGGSCSSVLVLTTDLSTATNLAVLIN